MPWQRKVPDADENDKPRKLTDEELRTIVDSLPEIAGSDPENRRLATGCVRTQLYEDLKQCEIAPSTIPLLIKAINDKHHRSLIAPGTTVGSTAAESIGAMSVQMSLNTFHTSGSAKSVSAGIDSLKDVIFARPEPKMTNMNIFFKNRGLTFDDVLGMRSKVVGVTIMNFVKNMSHITVVVSAASVKEKK